jgi:hypothetical protein
MSAHYRWFKGYKLHLCMTAEGIILSHIFTTANRNDMRVPPKLLSSLQEWDIEFVLGDVAYDSVKIHKAAKQSGILFISPIHRRNNDERKDTHNRVIPVLLKMKN